MKCIYCNNPYTYLLADSQRKCSQCKRKFSPKKRERELLVYTHFQAGDTARKTALATKMHFATIQNYFEKFRHDILLYSDKIYQHNSHRVTDYDEYLYLPKSLKAEENIEKMQHFLTLAYDNTIYCIMMPKTKNALIDNNSRANKKLLLKYFTFNKISKLSKSSTIITDFWNYFEEFICQFRGISEDKFILYLKEAEWRFNTNLD
ncbi:MAG TPA: transposase [Sulfurimonas autotrophica]|nr:transposase [Sulfurimonas autotrophica]